MYLLKMRIPEVNPIAKSAIGLFIMTLLLKIAGYGEKLALAYYFGTSNSADAYTLVLTILLSFFFFFREVVEPGLLNGFMRSNDATAWNLFNYVLRILVFTTICIVTLGMLYPEYIIQIFAPGFNLANRLLSTQLFRIAAPAILFLSLSTVTNIILNAQKVFILPAAGDIAFKVATIVSIVALSSQFGIVSAAFGILIGAVVKFSIHLIPLYKRISLTPIDISRDNKRGMWALTWPLIIGMLFSQATGLIDNLFASYMEKGSIAALSYARKIIELPIMIFPYILSVIVFPYFTQFSIEKDNVKSVALLLQSIRWIIIVFIPLTIYFSFFSYEIVSIIFKRGAFDEHSTMLTANPLFIYSIGLLFFAVEAIVVIFYYANADTKTPIVVGIVCVCVNIFLTYILIPYVGYLAIAIALVVQKALKIIILTNLLRSKISLQRDATIGFMGRLLVPAVVFVFTLALLNYFFAPDKDTGFIERIGFLAGSFFLACVIYVWILVRFNVVRINFFLKTGA
jgi:putative peptidoglycan lipid II flippase